MNMKSYSARNVTLEMNLWKVSYPFRTLNLEEKDTAKQLWHPINWHCNRHQPYEKINF